MECSKEAAVGACKKLPNWIGTKETTPPEDIEEEMQLLLARCSRKKTLEDLLEFHAAFQSIHPFSDGNGRTGILILFKECLKHHRMPFILYEDLQAFDDRGLDQWKKEPGYRLDTCRLVQDRFQAFLNS